MAKMRVGIIGAGRIAVIMAETLRKMRGVEAYAIASRSLEKAQAFAFEHGMTKAYGSYEEMLQDKKLDLVYIATPHTLHLTHAKLCIDYGKPVLVEKPFCVNAAQAQELLDYAKEKGVFITEAIWVRYLPMYETIKQTLDSGIIGKPKLLTANLGYEMTEKERLVDPKLAGGALLDVGIYPLNFAYMLFGNDIDKIEASAVLKDGIDTQDSMTLTYKDGRMAVLNSSMVAVSDRLGIIQGTKGYMVIENINNYQSMTVYDADYKKILYRKCPKQISGYEYEVLACRDALKKKALSCEAMPHEEIMRLMHAMDEIREKIGLAYPCETEDGKTEEKN